MTRKKKPKPLTKALALRIRAYKQTNPGLSNASISRLFCVHRGRVTEAIKGLRDRP